MPMSRLLEEVSREHFPYPPAMPEEVEEFEQRVGWKFCTPSTCTATGRS
ncbi:hypothetical protein ACN28S_06395 [Cystobacter fuscus]